MRILVATDAWRPQISGVVRTLEALATAVHASGSTLDFLTPDGFASLPLPTYPGLRCALPRPGEIARRIERVRPDAIHVATEGPIGFFVRRFCLQRALPRARDVLLRVNPDPRQGDDQRDDRSHD